MPKKEQPSKPVTAEDVRKYAELCSDFSFEMQALRLLSRLNLACEHSGTYKDPATGKPREFDIRAVNYQGQNLGYFAVECKNIRESSPLVIHTVPRPQEDSFHQVLIRDSLGVQSSFETKSRGSSWRVVEVKGHRTRYESGAPVGKHIDQVAHLDDAGLTNLQKRDGNAWEKLNQALQSSHDLIARAVKDITTGSGWAAAIVPILVVPDGRLWTIPYDGNGGLSGAPAQVDQVSVLVRHTIDASTAWGDVKLTISHAELATLSGLHELIAKLRGTGVFF